MSAIHPTPPEIPGYRLLHPLGRGGMGEVWAGEHVETGLPVALKWLHRTEPAGLAREIQAIARLDHPHILRIYDQGVASGRPYFVMALAEGTLGVTPQPWPRLRALLLALLDALAHAHARGVIHRDIKPANLLRADGRVLLADFGVSALLEEAGESRVSGSVPYMAPEQLAGRWRASGPWTDLFALGCVAFELAVGRRLFPAADTPRTFHPDFYPELAQIPGLGGWLSRMLAHAPGARFQRAADAAHALTGLPGELQAHGALPSFAAPVASAGQTMSLEGTQTVWGLAVPSVPVSPGTAPAAALGASALPPCPADWQQPPRLRVPPRGMGLGLYQQRRIPLAGREAERTRLWDALRRVHVPGGVEIIAVRGPPGGGRSQLARWLVERADEVGAAQVIAVPYAAVEGLLPALLHTLRASGLSGEALATQLHEALSGSAHAQAPALARAVEVATAAQAPVRGLRAAVAVLAAMSRERPVLVWLDDVHQSQEPAALVQQVRRVAGAGARILVVATLPDTEPAGDCDEEIVLGPLSPAGQLQLVGDLLFLEEPLALRVIQHTGGDPGFITAMVQSWIEQDLLESGESGFRLRDGEALVLPVDLQAVWLARVAAICAPDSPVWQRLERAAALGGWVAQEIWAAACADLGDNTEVIPLVRRLMVHGLVDEEDREEGRGFRWRALALPRSLEQHARGAGRWPEHCRRCALALQPIQTDEARIKHKRRQATLARLWLDGGSPAQALPALLWAIHLNRALNDWRAIPRWIQQVETIVEQLALPRDHPHRLQGIMYRAIERSLSGHDSEAHRLVETLVQCRAGVRWQPILENELLTFGLVQARMRQDLAALRWWRAQILENPTQHDSAVLFAHALLLKLLAADVVQHREEIRELVAQVVGLPTLVLEALPWSQQSGILTGRKFLADALVMVGELGLAEQIATENIVFCQQEGQEIHRSRSLDTLAEIAMVRGDHAAARAFTAQSLEILDAEQQRTAPATRAELGLLELLSGAVAAAGYHLRRAQGELERQGNQRYLRTMRPCLLWLALGEGRREDAAAILVEMERSTWRFHRYADWLRLVSTALHAQGDEAEIVRRCWRLELAQREATHERERCAVLRALLGEDQGL